MRYEGFFDRVKEWAKIHNETIEGILAIATNKRVTRDVYQGWRRRQTLPSGEFCYDIAQYMGVSTDWLISGTERVPIAEKYAGILRDLEEMDADTLENAKIVISSLAEKCREKSANTAAG